MLLLVGTWALSVQLHLRCRFYSVARGKKKKKKVKLLHNFLSPFLLMCLSGNSGVSLLIPCRIHLLLCCPYKLEKMKSLVISFLNYFPFPSYSQSVISVNRKRMYNFPIIFEY